ncbi:hypothetical protein NEFER03_0134 [Nematocida sp. LUAm3]|nr:hypothetical protein NEFER03_0134 [Nematocida sp. LUAm3]KAI5173587.1 hypothetical protein NEFER02_0103 [Nematocida sp. LUAm2]KAI5176808.1 hypothetical protein NEFER01_0133 [Nematocida sp. LUAm1]
MGTIKKKEEKEEKKKEEEKEFIKLQQTEKNLFRDLMEYNKREELGIVFRVAGGWVRDKIMGIECNDIDIAIDTVSGSVFAYGFLHYLKKKKKNVYGYRVVAQNHEKSKHLETASMIYSGYSIDFVALRTETYTTSRIPIVQIGTPKEDALRRDLTINSLFYNVNTQKIEDYTEKGVEDMQNRIIRTPLPPKETFLDDPLRILRALRFAARFHFAIDHAISEALSESAVVEKLSEIVSRERMGQEMKKTLQLPNYYVAMQSILRHGIHKVLFPQVPIEDTNAAAEYMKHQKQIFEDTPINHPYISIPDAQMHLLSLFSILQYTVHISKTKKEHVSGSTVVNDLKWSKKEKKTVENIVDSLLYIENALNRAKEKDITILDRWIKKTISPINISNREVLIRIIRKTEENFPLILTIYELILKTKNKEILDISLIHEDIISLSYESVWRHPPPVTYKELMQQFPLPPEKVKELQEEATVFSILHEVSDKKRVIRYITHALSTHTTHSNE